MLQLLLENAWLVIGLGGAIVIALIIGWVQSGNTIAFWTAIGFAILTVVGVLVSNWVRTDREVITEMLYQTADDLEMNRFDKVSAVIHPSANQEVREAEAQMKQSRFTLANITNLHEIQVDRRRQPHRATAKMNVIVQASHQGAEAKVPRYVELTLIQSGDRWLVHDFKHDDLMRGFQVDNTSAPR